MATMCVHINKDMRRKMRERPDINWSQVVRRAVEQELRKNEIACKTQTLRKPREAEAIYPTMKSHPPESKMKSISKPVPQPIVFPRADPELLKQFDSSTKYCTMNCGPHRDDPRTNAERKFLCGDCHETT